MVIFSRNRVPSIALVAWAAAALACLAAPASALEHTRMEPVWIESAAPDGEEGHTAAALLNLPPGWMIGDAAALVLSDASWPGLARERLVAALLDEEAAVLEFDATAARRIGPEAARLGPEPTTAETALDLRAAADTMRRQIGAGLVVTLGHGAAGEAALLAAALERTAGPAGGKGVTVAAASLGPGAPRFALGGAAPGRGWPVRAERLCMVLAAVRVPADASAERQCLRALIGASEAQLARAARP